MPTGKIIDPKLFQPGVTVRMVKARRYGVIESVNHEKGTAIVAWYEADPNDANSLTPNNTKISGKPTSLRYLITHSGPIPAPRVTNPPEKRAWYETARAHLSEDQKRQLERFGPQDLIKRTWLDTPQEQNDAQQFLHDHNLSAQKLLADERKWIIQNSQTDRTVKGLKRRVDYQCSCGVYNATPNDRLTRAPCVRAWPYEKCLAIVRVTYILNDDGGSDERSRRLDWDKRVKAIESVQGYLTHTPGCARATYNPVRNKKKAKGYGQGPDSTSQVQRCRSLVKEAFDSITLLQNCEENTRRFKNVRVLSAQQNEDMTSLATSLRALVGSREFFMLRKAAQQAVVSIRGPEPGMAALHQVEDQSQLYQRAPLTMRDAGLGDQAGHPGLPHGMGQLNLATLSTAAAAMQVASMPQSAPMGAVDTSSNFFNQPPHAFQSSAANQYAYATTSTPHMYQPQQNALSQNMLQNMSGMSYYDMPALYNQPHQAQQRQPEGSNKRARTQL